MKRDAKDWILTIRMTHPNFEEKYGMKAEKTDFQSDNEFEDDYDDDAHLVSFEFCYEVDNVFSGE